MIIIKEMQIKQMFILKATVFVYPNDVLPHLIINTISHLEMYLKIRGFVFFFGMFFFF